MNSFKVKEHLVALLSGKVTVDDLRAIGTPEAEEAVTISARNFNEVTMASRDILSAMTSKFVTKIKAGAFHTLVKFGIPKADAITLVGKVLEFQINWAWTNEGQIYLTALTRLPEGRNGFAIPLEAVLQDFDAAQCRRLVKWVLDRAAISKSLN